MVLQCCFQICVVLYLLDLDKRFLYETEEQLFYHFFFFALLHINHYIRILELITNFLALYSFVFVNLVLYDICKRGCPKNGLISEAGCDHRIQTHLLK